MTTFFRGLSGRCVLLASALIAITGCGGSSELAGSPPPPPPPPAAPSVTSVLLAPDSVQVAEGGQQQFSAMARYSDGTTGSITVAWGADGGTISATGLYTAGSVPGAFQVVATDSASGQADISAVTISALPPPGPYQTLARQDWSTYADKAALSALGFGVEGQNNLHFTPVLPREAFYDLVPDPIFGKVVRYNGGPQLNPDSANAPGRVATYQVALGVVGQPNATWWTAPPGFPFANGKTYFPTDLWVRQFFRTSPNWTNLSTTGGQGAADYKTMFLRYWNSPARHEVHFGVHERGLWHTGGVSAGNLLGWTQTSGGRLPISNTQTLDASYNISGWPYVDLFPLIRASGPLSPAFLAAPWGPGQGEWIEIIVHHKTVAERGEFSLYWREYTVGGVVNPQPWQIDATFVVGSPGQTFRGISNYQMGVNRNRQYDETMYHYWGPYEVVDGSQYPNPWNLPGG